MPMLILSSINKGFSPQNLNLSYTKTPKRNCLEVDPHISKQTLNFITATVQQASELQKRITDNLLHRKPLNEATKSPKSGGKTIQREDISILKEFSSRAH